MCASQMLGTQVRQRAGRIWTDSLTHPKWHEWSQECYSGGIKLKVHTTLAVNVQAGHVTKPKRFKAHAFDGTCCAFLQLPASVECNGLAGRMFKDHPGSSTCLGCICQHEGCRCQCCCGWANTSSSCPKSGGDHCPSSLTFFMAAACCKLCAMIWMITSCPG